MQTISGMVNEIRPFKQGTGKRGPWTLWEVVIDGTRVKAGFDKPSYNVGDTVSVQATQNKYGDLEMVQPGKPVGGKSAPPRAAGTGQVAARGYDRTFPVKTDSPEQAIIRQNALTNANAAVAKWFELAAGETPLPEDLAAYTELVIETAYKFTEFSSGQREVNYVANMKKD